MKSRIGLGGRGGGGLDPLLRCCGLCLLESLGIRRARRFLASVLRRRLCCCVGVRLGVELAWVFMG